MNELQYFDIKTDMETNVRRVVDLWTRDYNVVESSYRNFVNNRSRETSYYRNCDDLNAFKQANKNVYFGTCWKPYNQVIE